MNKEELKEFVEKKIYELQNCKTAVEITEHASYFTRLILSNQELQAKLDKCIPLPCKVGDELYYLKCGDKSLTPTKVVSLKVLNLYQIIHLMQVGLLNHSVFLTKEEAQQRLKELEEECKR